MPFKTTLEFVDPENILLDKSTYEAIDKFLQEISIQEMKQAATSAKGLTAEVSE
jgi:hypothetical protein